MNLIRIAVLGTSDIAYKRFLPSLLKNEKFYYVGVGSREVTKAEAFVTQYGGEVFSGYDAVIESDQVDAVYIPLPPALHYQWALKALKMGKHVFLEKPATTAYEDTCKLISIARAKGLALKENYMFLHHKQLKHIVSMVEHRKLGDVRLIRIAFGFPFRGVTDFRYNKLLGGGALLDCGGYAVRLASFLLGDTMKVISSFSGFEAAHDVDIYGSAVMRNDNGVEAQIAFGMNNSYKCELEIWGSEGALLAPRIFTPPPQLCPEIVVTNKAGKQIILVDQDDQFGGSIEHFHRCIAEKADREKEYTSLIVQGNILRDFENGAAK